jgi:uncharacterized protein involved in exopolysaccharide biosynthesis
MELVHVLKALWRMRLAVAAAFLVAAAAAAGLYMKQTSVKVGTASAEILVDGQKSALGDLRLQTLPLVARSGIFARFLGADGVTETIAREAGIPKDDIAVLGPKLRVDGVPDPESAERANRLRGNAGHLLQVQQGDNLPLLTIFAQGPTKESAKRLADATAAALEDYVMREQTESELPEYRRVKIRQLGSARAGTFESKPNVLLPAVAFCVLFGGACFALLGMRRMVDAWRGPDSVSAAPHAQFEGEWQPPFDADELDELFLTPEQSPGANGGAATDGDYASRIKSLGS